MYWQLKPIRLETACHSKGTRLDLAASLGESFQKQSFPNCLSSMIRKIEGPTMSVPFLAAPSLPVYITSQGNITKSIGFFSHQKAPLMLGVEEGEGGGHTFSASTWETGRWISGFETSLVYKVRSRTARAIHKNQSQKTKSSS